MALVMTPPPTEWYTETGGHLLVEGFCRIYQKRNIETPLSDRATKDERNPFLILKELKASGKLIDTEVKDIFASLVRDLIKFRETAESASDKRLPSILTRFAQVVQGVKARELKEKSDERTVEILVQQKNKAATLEMALMEVKDREDMAKTFEAPVKQNSEDDEWEVASFETAVELGSSSTPVKFATRARVDQQEKNDATVGEDKGDADDEWVMVQDGKGEARPVVDAGSKRSFGKVLKSFTGLMRD
ncbi:hypothetical protein PMZ80_004040 [Knufia obscura]|uniref:Uncharacterized protein n=2 Tax=Knufia TaxID=430999 RepID=A0AAN8ECQ7_9EURO|nr:hypothetical protein PMZ80_004040 [Knufia obscura]KAK5952233.1 hypothetical protein OHC33_006706 [Knufia fluminis]